MRVAAGLGWGGRAGGRGSRGLSAHQTSDGKQSVIRCLVVWFGDEQTAAFISERNSLLKLHSTFLDVDKVPDPAITRARAAGTWVCPACMSSSPAFLLSSQRPSGPQAELAFSSLRSFAQVIPGVSSYRWFVTIFQIKACVKEKGREGKGRKRRGRKDFPLEGDLS